MHTQMILNARDRELARRGRYGRFGMFMKTAPQTEDVVFKYFLLVA
jgi:predicted nucleotidyltransferase